MKISVVKWLSGKFQTLTTFIAKKYSAFSFSFKKMLFGNVWFNFQPQTDIQSVLKIHQG